MNAKDEQQVDYIKFRKDAGKLLDLLGADYYIKKSLAELYEDVKGISKKFRGGPDNRTIADSTNERHEVSIGDMRQTCISRFSP